MPLSGESKVASIPKLRP